MCCYQDTPGAEFEEGFGAWVVDAREVPFSCYATCSEERYNNLLRKEKTPPFLMKESPSKEESNKNE